MKLYDETGEREKALRAVETVLTKEPKVQSKAIEEMREDARKVCVGNFQPVQSEK
jgi:hypothetical protein